VRVLITGGVSGQLRHELLRAAPAEALLVGPAADGESARLDVTDAAAVAECVARYAPELILNAAAYTHVDRAESEPAAARAVNVDGVRHLAEAALEANARLVHVSTDFVFGGSATGRALARSGGPSGEHRSGVEGWDVAPPFTEDAPTAPLGVYGESKRDGERVLAAVLPESGCLVRTSWVYGAHGANFVRTMLRLMGERDEIGVVADQIGTPTSARSLARALWRAAELELGGTLHWSDAGVASWYDLAVAVLEEARALGLLTARPRIVPLRTDQYPTPAARPAVSVLETSRSRERLGLPAVHWREELRLVLGELA